MDPPEGTERTSGSKDVAVGHHHRKVRGQAPDLLQGSPLPWGFPGRGREAPSSATSRTGEGVSFRPLPEGRSGWVTTPTIS